MKRKLFRRLRLWRAAVLLAAALLSASSFAQAQRTTPTRGASGLGGATREYPNSTMVGDALISSDPETRRLIVITDEETNEHIREVITNIDRPKPQVLIKVVFLEVTHTDDLDVGVDARYVTREGSYTNTIGQNFMGLFGLPAQSLGSGGFYQLLSDDLEVTLRALAAAGKTEVLSRPSILARNNQQATIIVGSELPFITNSRITDQGQTINTVQYQDIGIILRVTPFITSDGLVEMIVSPEISTLTAQTVPISDTVSAPVIAKRAADTVVVTPNGKTVVIGGLMENNKTMSERKVPLLGDIPLLGNLFKRKIKSDTKTELIIFLTPYVVAEPGQLAELTAHEAGQAELAPKAFSEQELQKYIDGVPMKQPEEPTRRRR